MKTNRWIITAIAVVMAGGYHLEPALAQTPAAATPIFKTSIQVATNTRRYYVNPGGERDEDTWSWAPCVKFNVQGPLPSGSQFSVEFFQGGGKPWVSYECKTPQVDADKTAGIECGYGIPPEQLKGITSTGVFTFKIHMRNELRGSNESVFEGRFAVNKFHAGADLPKTKNNFEFYVDHDWQLPISFVWCPQPSRSADGVMYFDDYSPLYTAFWFKGGALPERELAAYLFYQGREISNTKSHGHAVPDGSLATGQATSPYEYKRVRLEFTDVFAFVKDPQAHPGFYLNKNPGEYEIKVLRAGHLARSLTFTVGSDGKIVDNGIAGANGILGPRMIVPARVLGDTDGPWNAEAWRTEALYGNPLKGFALP
ncbi:MAG TPA: hypothetical protein VEZ90_02295 [Blastocatellia bacterium]|nr:hypothetical protein [Blastocatellia bacterium]